MFTAGYIRSLLVLVVAVAGFAAAGPASAVTFGFSSSPTAFVVNHEGFTWGGSKGASSLIRGTSARALPKGAPTAALGYASSNFAADITMRSSGLFSLDSIGIYGDSKLFGGKSSALTVRGYRDGVLLYTVVTGLLDALPRGVFTTLSLMFKDVNLVTFSTGLKQNLLLTDVNVRLASVPLPAGLALFGGGLGALGALGLRRRQKAHASSTRPG